MRTVQGSRMVGAVTRLAAAIHRIKVLTILIMPLKSLYITFMTYVEGSKSHKIILKCGRINAVFGVKNRTRIKYNLHDFLWYRTEIFGQLCLIAPILRTDWLMVCDP